MELFKLAVLKLRDGFDNLSSLTINVNELDLSVSYSLGNESMANLNIKKDKASLPDFVSFSNIRVVEDVVYCINNHSTRTVADQKISPVMHELEIRTTERLISAEEGV